MKNPKIRMIVSDVDGTLLEKGATRVSDDAFSAIKTATEAGIEFVIASGRNYLDLKSLFEPVLDLVTFICSDGALVLKNDAALFSSPIEKSLAKELILLPGGLLKGGVVIAAKDVLYSGKEFEKSEKTLPINNLDDVKEDIYKISFYNLSEFARCKVRSFAQRTGRLSEIYSDKNWTEFIATETDKGFACAALQKRLAITPFETAAFGDNTNDFGMLRRARLTYASHTAIPDIKKMCKFSTDNIPNEIIKLVQERSMS